MLQCGLLRSNFSLAIRVLPALLVPVTESLERVAGIEPASSAWKAAALPLCYTRLAKAALPHSPLLRRVVGEVGLEPTKPLQQRIYSPPPLPLGTFPQAGRQFRCPLRSRLRSRVALLGDGPKTAGGRPRGRGRQNRRASYSGETWPAQRRQAMVASD